MANKKKVNPANIKKIVAEIIIIPLCILYLYYEFFYNHVQVSNVFLYLLLLFTCVEFIVKYIKEVYIYKSKYNLLKIFFVIYNFLLIIFGVLSIFLKIRVISLVFIILVIGLLCYLLYYAIRHITNIINNKGTLYNNAVSSFLPLIAFCTILMGLIIYLK